MEKSKNVKSNEGKNVKIQKIFFKSDENREKKEEKNQLKNL